MFGSNPSSRKPAFGLYSQSAAELFGSYVYKTSEGKELVVTQVFNNKDGITDYLWPDKTFVGMVTEFVRWGKEPCRFDKDCKNRMGKRVA